MRSGFQITDQQFIKALIVVLLLGVLVPSEVVILGLLIKEILDRF